MIINPRSLMAYMPLTRVIVPVIAVSVCVCVRMCVCMYVLVGTLRLFERHFLHQWISLSSQNVSNSCQQRSHFGL